MLRGYNYPSEYNNFDFRPFYLDEYDDLAKTSVTHPYPTDLVLYPKDLEDIITDNKRAYQEVGDFVWETHNGKLYFPDEMETSHLFYTVRMLFNHSVPPAFRVGWCPKNRHDDVFEWPADYRQQALTELYSELKTRDDLGDSEKEELSDIKQNSKAIVSLGL